MKIGIAVTTALLAIPVISSAVLVESWESGTENGWFSDMAGANVNTTRATDGVYGFDTSFSVVLGMAGWTQNTALNNTNAQNFVSIGDTSLSVDIYSDWSNPEGWGVYDNEFHMIVNNEAGGYSWQGAASTTDLGGGWKTYEYDISALSTSMATSEWSHVSFAWHLGTWADNGAAVNGTHTVAFDNVNAVPEPATLGLVGLFGGAMLVLRRNFRI